MYERFLSVQGYHGVKIGILIRTSQPHTIIVALVDIVSSSSRRNLGGGVGTNPLVWVLVVA